MKKKSSLSPRPLGLFVFIISIWTTSLLMSGCSWKANEVGKQTVLQASEFSMSAKEFAEILAKKMSKYDALGAKDTYNLTRSKEEVVQEFVFSAIIKSWAKQNKISISKSDLQVEAKRLRSSFPDDLSFRKELAKEGISLSQWEKQLEVTLLQKKVMAVAIGGLPTPADDEVKKYYDANKDEYKHREKVYLRQILVSQSSDAERIKSAIKGNNFSALAKDFSIAPEAKNGGLVGWIELGSVDVFEKAFSLPLNRSSEIVESPFGFHIFLVEKKMPAGYEPLEKVKPLIQLRLKSQKEQAAFTKWLDAELRSIKVLRNNDIINSMVVETRKE